METCIRFFQILQSGTEIVGLRAFFVFGTGGNGKVPKNNQFNPFQPSVIFHKMETSPFICKYCKSNDWFLYEMQHWDEIA